MSNTVMVFCAHNDDQIVGAGGTLAKYAKQGKKIITVVFSYGEKSHPHLQTKVIVKSRVKESVNSNKILCGENSEILHLGLKEGKFTAEIDERDIIPKVKKIIKQHKPDKIFTHSIDDPHPDHRAVYQLVSGLKLPKSIDVYTFNVWNFFFNFRGRQSPKLVIDITDTFKVKVKAFESHKSQGIAKLGLMWYVYAQALILGMQNNMRYAEVFYKIR